MRYFILIFLIFLFLARLNSSTPHYNDGQKIRITAKVSSETKRYAFYQIANILNFSVKLPLYPVLEYGDTVTIEGYVSGKYINDAEIIKIQRSEFFLSKIRKELIMVIERSLPSPYSSLVSGVALGSKAGIGYDFWEDLKKTGTAHVVVASGMNVTLVAGFLINGLVLLVNRKKAIFIALAGIWAYAFIAGFDAPIIRAAVMGSIAFSAQALGRLNEAWRGLIISAIVMLLIKPLWIYDLGFILSFVATASLMLFEKRVRNYINWVPKLFREGLSTSLSAQIGVAPILFATFGQFNLLSPVINALVLWTIAPITIVGMASAVIGLFWFSLGKILLYSIFPLTFWFVKVVQIFS